MRSYKLWIRKDFISALAGYPLLPMLLVLWAAFMLFFTASIPLMFSLLFYSLVIALFQTEENDLVCNVLGILPIRRRQAIVGRYLYTYLVVFGQLAVALLLRAVAGLFRSRESIWPFSLTIGVCSCLMMAAISIPLIYRFGVVKMRIALLVVYGAMIGISSAAMPITDSVPLPEIPLALVNGGAVLLFFLISLVSLAISLRVAK